MATQHIETFIIGACQACLATGYELQRRGRELLIVDGVERVGDSWRRHRDSLRLFTPGKYNSLPRLPFPGGSWQFPGKDEVAAYLETYALVHDLPMRLRTRVDRLEGRAEGGFTAHLGAETITCENVVVATGGNGCVPRLPEFAGSSISASNSCTRACTSAPTSHRPAPRWWSGQPTPAARSPTSWPPTVR